MYSLIMFAILAFFMIVCIPILDRIEKVSPRSTEFAVVSGALIILAFVGYL